MFELVEKIKIKNLGSSIFKLKLFNISYSYYREKSGTLFMNILRMLAALLLCSLFNNMKKQKKISLIIYILNCKHVICSADFPRSGHINVLFFTRIELEVQT